MKYKVDVSKERIEKRFNMLSGEIETMLNTGDTPTIEHEILEKNGRRAMLHLSAIAHDLYEGMLEYESGGKRL